MSNTLLRVYPSELKIPFELKKQSTSTMQLTNKTDQYVAFKVKTTNPKKYAVRPTSGVVPPRSSCTVAITMQAPKDIPSDYHCKDKFLIQSVLVKDGTTSNDVVSEMFSKGTDKVVEEFKLRVIYIPANPPSPVPEEGEEDLSPRPFVSDSTSSISDAVLRPNVELLRDSDLDQEVSSSLISKLSKETASMVAQNQEIQRELELLTRDRRRGRRGYSFMLVVIVFTLSILIGYNYKSS